MLTKVFGELLDKASNLVLIVGALYVKDHQHTFESFNDSDVQKIRSGMQYLKDLIFGINNDCGILIASSIINSLVPIRSQDCICYVTVFSS